MKKYTVKNGENLGSIAAAFGLPSWKYLYELNKDAIGENPDLLQSGIELEIPEWENSGLDEKIEKKIEEKKAKKESFTGGMRYRYPWVPFSMTLTSLSEKKTLEDFDEERDVMIYRKESDEILYEGKMKKADEVNVLLPDCNDFTFGVKGMPLALGGRVHMHPDDEAAMKPDGESSGADEKMEDEE